MKKITLSPSSLSLFLECPRCFWLQIIKGKRRPNGIFSSLPSGMDRVIKRYFDNCRKKGIFPDIEIKGKLFDDMEKLNLWRNNWKGLTYEDEKSGIILKGAIDDLIVTENNKFVPVDFKTRGFPLKENTSEYYQHQMDLYCFLLEKNGMETPGYAYLVFYHPVLCRGNGMVFFEVDVVMMETDKDRGKKIFEDAVELLLQGYEPEPNPDCEWCRWNL